MLSDTVDGVDYPCCSDSEGWSILVKNRITRRKTTGVVSRSQDMFLTVYIVKCLMFRCVGFPDGKGRRLELSGKCAHD